MSSSQDTNSPLKIKITEDMKASMKSGDKKRLMNISKLNKTGFKNFTSLDLGIKKTVDWFNKNKKFILKKTTWFNMKCIDDSKMKPQKKEKIEKVEWMKDSSVQDILLNSYKTLNHVMKKYSEIKH